MVNEWTGPVDMLPEYTRRLLKEPPMLLQNFHYEDVLAFLNLGREEQHSGGVILIDEGEWLNSSRLLMEGKISLWRENVQFAELQPGSFIGETFLYRKFRTMSKFQADTDCIVLKFERHKILDFFKKKPGKLFNIFTKNIIEIQQRKISGMNMQIVQLKKRLLIENNGDTIK